MLFGTWESAFRDIALFIDAPGLSPNSIQPWSMDFCYSVNSSALIQPSGNFVGFMLLREGDILCFEIETRAQLLH